MKKKDHHVIPNKSGGWSVRRSGSTRASKIFNSKSSALKYARSIAKNENGDLYVHRKSGIVQQKDSYGHNPISPMKKR